MRVRTGLTAALLLMVGATSLAGEPVAPAPRSQTLLNGVAAKPGKAPFANGETLTHELYFKWMTVGTSTMAVETGATFEGQPAIHLTGEGSASPLPWVRVDGASESWIHPEELYSLGFLSDQDGPKIDDRQEWKLDNANAIATRDRVRKNGSEDAKSNHKEYKLAKTHVQDVLSMLYFFRAFPVTVGDELESDVYVSKRLWTLKIRILARETIKVPAGKYTCLKVQPELTRDGEKAEQGQVTVWVTDDERKIPVKIWTQTKFGKVEAALKRDSSPKR